jgi:hypothetical protein
MWAQLLDDVADGIVRQAVVGLEDAKAALEGSGSLLEELINDVAAALGPTATANRTNP